MPDIATSILSAVVGGAIVAGVMWSPFHKYISSRKAKTLAELEVYQRRLLDLVGELMRKADELDQAVKFNQPKLSSDWHEDFSRVCSELVKLGETVKSIETLLEKRELGSCRSLLMRSASIAHHLSDQLRSLKRDAGVEDIKRLNG